MGYAPMLGAYAARAIEIGTARSSKTANMIITNAADIYSSPFFSFSPLRIIPILEISF